MITGQTKSCKSLIPVLGGRRAAWIFKKNYSNKQASGKWSSTCQPFSTRKKKRIKKLGHLGSIRCTEVFFSVHLWFLSASSSRIRIQAWLETTQLDGAVHSKTAPPPLQPRRPSAALPWFQDFAGRNSLWHHVFWPDVQASQWLSVLYLPPTNLYTVNLCNFLVAILASTAKNQRPSSSVKASGWNCCCCKNLSCCLKVQPLHRPNKIVPDASAASWIPWLLPSRAFWAWPVSMWVVSLFLMFFFSTRQ